MSDLFGMFQPIGSRLERVAAGPKYGIFCLLTVPALLAQQWWLTAASLVATVGVIVWSGIGLRRGLRLSWVLLVLLGCVVAYHVISGTWLVGVVACGSIIGAIWAIRIVTLTTPMPALVDALVTAARPFRRLIPPERLGLAIAVMLRSVPALVDSFAAVRDATRARGVERNLVARTAPVAIRAVAYAQATADALAARGLGDD